MYIVSLYNESFYFNSCDLYVTWVEHNGIQLVILVFIFIICFNKITRILYENFLELSQNFRVCFQIFLHHIYKVN